MIQIEVIATSVEDALVAAASGADRIELGVALELGGLTPSVGLMRAVERVTALPVIAMLRPRPGGCAYSAAEFDVMLSDAHALLDAGCDGLAFGCLTAAGAVDAGRCRRIIDLLDRRAAVFHRAFDLTADPAAALEALIDLGVKRVLTSGGATTAPEGAPAIRSLVTQAASRIEILPAGGITPANVRALLQETGCTQVHGSFSRWEEDPTLDLRPGYRFSSQAQGEERIRRLDAEQVTAARAALNG